MKSRPLFSLLVTGPLAAVAMPLALFATILAKGTSKKRKLSVLLVGGVIFAISAAAPRLRISAQDSRAAFSPTIPKTWDDQAMATIEVPLMRSICAQELAAMLHGDHLRAMSVAALRPV